jgi:ABC-type nitrate/sulfonate/bicarbonate transport system permease component
MLTDHTLVTERETPGLSAEAAGPVPAPRARRRVGARAWWTTPVSLIAGVALWQILVRVLHPNPLAVVGPWDVLKDGRHLAAAGTLGTDVGVSLEEFAIGLVIAIAAGLLVGLALGLSEKAATFFDPWVSVLYTVPVIAIAPLLIVALGLGTTSKVVIVAVSAFFPVAINSQTGVRHVDRDLREVATAFGASRAETLRFVVLRGMAPYLLTGIRLGIGRGVIGLVAGDLFGSTKGLGYLILSGQQNLQTADVYVGVVVLALIGVILTAAVGLLERRFAPGMESKR